MASTLRAARLRSVSFGQRSRRCEVARTLTTRAMARRDYDPLDPAQQHAPKTACELIRTYLDNHVLAGAHDSSRVFALWCLVAGRRVGKHTMAVWAGHPKGAKEGPPELVVYLDGNALMADLTTNAELYVDRLAYAGFPVAQVRFRLSRKAGQATSSCVHTAPSSTDAAPYLPPLSAQERDEVELACAQLPTRLRDSASEAMRLSLRRNKGQSTSN